MNTYIQYTIYIFLWRNKKSRHTFCFNTPPQDNGGVLCYMLDIHVSFRPLYVHPFIHILFLDDNLNISGFSPNLVCALILWRSGLGLLMVKFCQILTELSARYIFLFPDNNFI